jgi:ubiquinone/menaquinone biosynthesis C-methylase UbiE
MKSIPEILPEPAVCATSLAALPLSVLCAVLWQWIGCCSLGEPVSAAAAAPGRYEFREPHDPNGIGKFYLGREIAHVMGHEAADWLERSERNAEEHTEQLVEHLKLAPGAVVADIGAGTGYYSRRLAKRVLPGGRVLAVDVQPEMLVLLTNKAAALGLTNVVPILGSVTNPNLPALSVDLVLLVDVYHEFDFPWEMMQAICQSLKPDGRVVFVEYRSEDPDVPIKLVHKMTEAQVRKEMSVQPLDWVQTINVLPWQHIIIFKKRQT